MLHMPISLQQNLTDPFEGPAAKHDPVPFTNRYQILRAFYHILLLRSPLPTTLTRNSSYL